ncbi:MAG TPA: hypothetical protein VE225_01405 [Rubrobacteraceae bacterium]|nr:hypothetical protein [Rubrobacteraceae bacterium]
MQRVTDFFEDEAGCGLEVQGVLRAREDFFGGYANAEYGQL